MFLWIFIRSELSQERDSDRPLRSNLHRKTNGTKRANRVTELTRFIGRKEYFGSLVYDREKADYIPFDKEATEIFEASHPKGAAGLPNRQNPANQQNLETFVQLCQDIGILDSKRKFTGTFIGRDWSKENQLSAPLKVYFSCTKSCNFRCKHCYSSSGDPYPDELTTQEIKKLIDELANIGCFEMAIGGGEPFLRNDLPEIIQHANLRGISVRLRTNGTHVSKDAVRRLKDMKIRSIKVSLEGASEKVYDYVRGREGSFRKVLRGIKNLKELGVPIHLQMVLMKTNVSELPAFIRMGEKLKVEKVLIETVMPVGRALQNASLLLDRNETNHLWESVLKFQKNTPVKIEIPNYVPYKTGNSLLFEGFGCKCGTLVCHIDPRGTVAPTGFLKDMMPAGNLREKSLKQIWDTAPPLVQFRNFEGNETCGTCNHYSACRGGCRARALFVDSNINLPDGFCLIAHP